MLGFTFFLWGRGVDNILGGDSRSKIILVWGYFVVFREWLKFYRGGGIVLERAGAVVENIKRQSM